MRNLSFRKSNLSLRKTAQMGTLRVPICSIWLRQSRGRMHTNTLIIVYVVHKCITSSLKVSLLTALFLVTERQL